MSEKYRLIILKEAQQDIRGIIRYIAGELCAPQAAIKLQDDFQKSINSLSTMPERIKKVDEQPWHNEGLRRMQVKNYYVYFVIDNESMEVKITAVIYVGRDQSKQLGDRM